MDNSIKELGKIRDSIINSGISESRLREAMNKLKKEYGDEIFKNYDLNSVRQYTYSKAYYERLVQLAKNGASSQDFYIHLLRVRDAVKKQRIINIMKTFTCCVFILCSIFTFILSSQNKLKLKQIQNSLNSLQEKILENIQAEKIQDIYKKAISETSEKIIVQETE